MPHNEKNKSMRFVTNQTKIDPSTKDQTQLLLAKNELIYSILGLVLGLCCILGGLALFMNGISGSTSWTANFWGGESKITDAAPGAILFIVGLFFVLLTRYRFSHISKE